MDARVRGEMGEGGWYQEGVFPWVKNLPLAPEYYPTTAEFQDPISYIFKIEKEASKYGICKVVPPVLPSPKKAAISELKRSLAGPFTTRQQQIGFCPRRPLAPVERPVWESGEKYTYQEFEAKARLFERLYLRRHSKRRVDRAALLSPLEIETLYWRATVDKPFSVEYANDMPGSAFPFTKNTAGATVGETPWNMKGVSRAKGSLLRFMKEEIPGVTSPMVYIAMLFSWFAWHVEDHDLHSLNYLHSGASKTWYGVPWEAASAFEEVVRVHGYAGEINPLVMFAILGEKTTVISPEVIVGAGVPCCRLVQNPGEFVVTFPRAYHSGFSHGFNLGEAANIATPGWLPLAKDAAIRRASINYPPMVSHFQLLYDLAVELQTSLPVGMSSKPRSSRLKEKQKGDGENLVKELFLRSIKKNNDLLQALGKGCPVVQLPRSSVDVSICSNLRVGSQPRVMRYVSDDENESRKTGGQFGGMNGEKPNRRLFACVKCGILCFDCVAVIKPSEASARFMVSADCNTLQMATSNRIRREEIPPVECAETALNLLAITYGDSSDEDESPKPKAPGFDDEKERWAFESCEGERSLMHVFCLEHALEVEQQLRLVGGARLWLFCHPEYPRMEAEAKAVLPVSEDDDRWNNIIYSEATPEDEKLIQLALDNEEAEPVNSDWSVKLGINLFYSAKLSWSPLYSKQMPYNSVIYEAFGRSSPAKLRRYAKMKKVVAGKWCGKVWMSNQVHPFLIKWDRHLDDDDVELDQENEFGDDKFEKKRNDENAKQCAKKRKLTDEGRPIRRKYKYLPLNSDGSYDSGDAISYQRYLQTLSLKKKRSLHNSEDDVSVDSAEVECGLYNEELSEDSSEEIKFRTRKVESCDEEDGSDNSIDSSSFFTPARNSKWIKPANRAFLKKYNVKKSTNISTAIVDEYSVDLALGSASKKKRTKFRTREDSFRRTPAKGKIVEFLEEESDDSGGHQTHQRRRMLESLRSNSEEESYRKLKSIVPGKKRGRVVRVEEDNSEESCDSDPKSTRQRKSKRITCKLLMEKVTREIANGDELKEGRSARARKTKQHRDSKIAKGGKRKREDGEHECDMEGCAMSFNTRQELALHKRNICPVKGCGKKFFSHKYLVQHRRVHLDDRPLKCPWKGCKMSFKWAWARTEHIRIHTGDRPYVCAHEGCTQTFRFVSDFSRHKRKTGHSGKKSAPQSHVANLSLDVPI